MPAAWGKDGNIVPPAGGESALPGLRGMAGFGKSFCNRFAIVLMELSLPFGDGGICYCASGFIGLAGMPP